MQDRHRHLRAVMRGRHDAGGDVVGRIVAGGNFLTLAQSSRAARHVVVIDFRRRRHRRIGKAQIGGVEFIAAHRIQRIGRLVERNRMFVRRFEIADHDGGQRVGALQPHQMAGIEFDIDDVDAVAVRDQVAPVGAFRRFQRRGDDLEVDGAVGIGENEQLVAAIGDRILHAFLARRDQTRLRRGIGEIDQPLLRGFVVAAGDHAETPAGAFVDMGEPAGVLLLIDQQIVRLRRAEAMTPDLHRAMVVVELHVEEGFGIRSPHHLAVGFLDEVVMIRAVGPVAHADREIFRALDIGAPGDQLVVRRMPAAAELEIVVPGRKLVAVEHDLDLAAVARHAAEHFVLAALAEFSEIGEGTVRRRHAGIILLDPPAHFRDQRLLQGGGVAEQAFGVAVLGLEIVPDIRIQQRGIAQHLLPVGILQPGIVVRDRDAVGGEGMRTTRRHRGRL